MAKNRDISKLPKAEQDAIDKRLKEIYDADKKKNDKNYKSQYDLLVLLRNKYVDEITKLKEEHKIPKRASLKKLCDFPGKDREGKQKGPSDNAAIANWMRRNYGEDAGKRKTKAKTTSSTKTPAKKTPSTKTPPTKKPAAKKK